MSFEEHEEQHFAARWSLLVWVLSVGGIVIAVLVGAGLMLMAAYSGHRETIVRLALVVAAFGPAVILGVVALFAPRAYTLTDDAIVIHRRGPAVVIPRGQLLEVRRVRSGDVGFAWRLFGSGGFFGWFGLFYSRNVGQFWAYVTNQEDLVLLVQADETRILISPHPAHAFLDAIRRTQPPSF